MNDQDDTNEGERHSDSPDTAFLAFDLLPELNAAVHWMTPGGGAEPLIVGHQARSCHTVDDEELVVGHQARSCQTVNDKELSS